jgi:predicted nucleotidyltransferase
LFICGCTVRWQEARQLQHLTVDLIADLDGSKNLSLLDMVGLENRLSDLLGEPVDLSPAHTLKQPVANRAANEAVIAF